MAEHLARDRELVLGVERQYLVVQAVRRLEGRELEGLAVELEAVAQYVQRALEVEFLDQRADDQASPAPFRAGRASAPRARAAWFPGTRRPAPGTARARRPTRRWRPAASRPAGAGLRRRIRKRARWSECSFVSTLRQTSASPGLSSFDRTTGATGAEAGSSVPVDINRQAPSPLPPPPCCASRAVPLWIRRFFRSTGTRSNFPNGPSPR
jgi:hypothetical protein